ncbi:MAG TPA: hypothetical protein VET65_06900 [Candidatus Limnocylindrales bacterium]|nr:hypothetical protein [Candidatus Limnocylindrales bacterium]
MSDDARDPAAATDASPAATRPADVPPASTSLIVVPAKEAPAAVEAKETCPTCGKTSVFAGPPGHRYCMHCALRQELFDASAAAHH